MIKMSSANKQYKTSSFTSCLGMEPRRGSSRWLWTNENKALAYTAVLACHGKQKSFYESSFWFDLLEMHKTKTPACISFSDPASARLCFQHSSPHRKLVIFLSDVYAGEMVPGRFCVGQHKSPLNAILYAFPSSTIINEDTWLNRIFNLFDTAKGKTHLQLHFQRESICMNIMLNDTGLKRSPKSVEHGLKRISSPKLLAAVPTFRT